MQANAEQIASQIVTKAIMDDPFMTEAQKKTLAQQALSAAREAIGIVERVRHRRPMSRQA